MPGLRRDRHHKFDETWGNLAHISQKQEITVHDDFSSYEASRDAGHDPLAAYLAAKADGLDTFARIRMLRAVYGLSLIEAKDVATVGDTGQDANSHQAGLAAELDTAFDRADE